MKLNETMWNSRPDAICAIRNFTPLEKALPGGNNPKVAEIINYGYDNECNLKETNILLLI